MPISPSLYRLIDAGRLAASVHNTQPWQFSVLDEQHMTLEVASERMLEAGDPTKRELWISLGACLETLVLAARSYGDTLHIEALQTESLSEPIARLRLEPSTVATDDTILEAIKKRHSHRGIFRRVDLPNSLTDAITRATASLDGASVLTTTSPDAIKLVARLTGRSMRLAFSSPAFRQELGDLVHPNWSQKAVGMHGYVLNKNIFNSLWEKVSITAGWQIDNKANDDERKITEASALFFVATDGDTPAYWLRAGRAYTELCIELTKAGLAHSTIAGPIEAASFHEDIEALLGTTQRLQVMVRVGAAVPLRRTSPRLSVEALVTSHPATAGPGEYAADAPDDDSPSSDQAEAERPAK